MGLWTDASHRTAAPHWLDTRPPSPIILRTIPAAMAELADALDSGSSVRKDVEVQLLLAAFN